MFRSIILAMAMRILLKKQMKLKVDAQIDFSLESCEWSPCIFGLIDKFGVNWFV